MLAETASLDFCYTINAAQCWELAEGVFSSMVSPDQITGKPMFEKPKVRG